MQLFCGGDEFAKKKDIINPNLLSNSKGVFQPKSNNADNWEAYPNSTAYLEQNQTYTISGKTNMGVTATNCIDNQFFTVSLSKNSKGGINASSTYPSDNSSDAQEITSITLRIY